MEAWLGFEEFGVDGVGGTLALEEGGDVLGGGVGHAAASFGGGGAEMRGENYVGTLEAGVNEGLLLENVEAGAGNFFGFESVDKRSFVDNGAAGGVDEEGGGLHAEEF